MGDLPDIALGSCCGSLSGGSIALVNTQQGNKENSECSLHGRCDRSSGICECDSGYTSSDGSGNIGTRGDCGASLTTDSCTSEYCVFTQNSAVFNNQGRRL